jgi:iron complex transport system permease protein
MNDEHQDGSEDAPHYSSVSIARRYPWSIVSVAALALALTCGGSLLCGITTYSPKMIYSDLEARSIVLNLRLPRTILAVLVGAGLSMVGACYQALFRNYLASPFTLGVSSGAALAASSALVFGLTSSSIGLDISACAIIGAVVSIVLITSMSIRQRYNAGGTLLLNGVVYSFFCSSLLTLIQYLCDYTQLFRITRWMMGGIPAVEWSDLVIGGVCVGVTFAWLMRNARDLDLMLFGDDIATVKGIDVLRLTRASFVLTSFVVGWIVAQCGVIGFVGIIVPAVCRLIIGIRHKFLIPLACVVGGILVVACDVVGRVAIAPFEIPAGVFTSVLGGPVFVAIMLTQGRKSPALL